MMENTKSRIALITGATRGIGRETAILLAKNKIHVILLGRTLSALDDLSDKINDFGGSSSCIQFDLNDLRSRAKNFILQDIKKPDDQLMFALIFKSLSDRQISLDQKLISYIIKRIERSYVEINDFIYKIDELSLKKKKSIDLKLIKEVLGE